MKGTQHHGHGGDHVLEEDTKTLHSMGYAQELHRRMGAFQNFAISFAIICILAGGITAFPNGFSAAGGASIGIGWPLGIVFAMMVAAAMGQIASAYPTAGGIYHWSSILGGRGFGWVAAWMNLLGLLFVVASVNYGVYLLSRDLIAVGVLGMDVSGWGSTQLITVVALVTITQALFNYAGIRATTMLTDFSGYLIFAVATVLTLSLLAWSPVPLDFSRLFTFSNNTGAVGGDVWPQASSLLYAFGLGLILVCYTVTGFDASAHTAEETRNAATEVPKGMMRSVFWSGVFGYVMICSFVLAMPDVKEAASKGFTAFFYVMDSSQMPLALKKALYVGIVLANYLCALAGLTSCSRMIYAFARDGGFPGISGWLDKVSPTHRTPGNAILLGAVLCFGLGLYVGFDQRAFVALAAGCAVALYISYLMPVAAGLLAEGNSWTKKGPFNLGGASKLVSILAIIGGSVLVFIGVQPPNQVVGQLIAGLLVALGVFWWVLGERNRFEGPPLSADAVARRQAKITAAEKALDQAA
jgi:amino acid transporter